MKETIYDKLRDWAEERYIDKLSFDKVGFTQNIIEELTEMWNVPKNKQREVAKALTKYIQTEAIVSNAEASEDEVTDAICDISVFCATGQVQRGVDMNKAMEETYKEISSRRGAYSEEEKKWCKFTDEESKKLWYAANYSECRLEDK